MGLSFAGLVLVLVAGACWIWPRRGIKGQMKILTWALVLAVATAGVSWFGIRDWDGENGGNALAFLGLPLWLCAFGLHRVHPAAAWGLGVAAQLICCWVLVGIAWGVTLAARSGGQATKKH